MPGSNDVEDSISQIAKEQDEAYFGQTRKMIQHYNLDSPYHISFKNNEFSVIFKSGFAESTTFDENNNLNLTKKTVKRIEFLINKNLNQLIKTAKDYHKSRNMPDFIIDFVSLCKATEELPETFSKLVEVTHGDMLLHNRLQAQIALSYVKKYPDMKIEVKRNNKIPDLFVNDIFIDIKTILKPFYGDYLGFNKTVQNTLKKGKKQTSSKGVIFIGIWSKYITGALKNYFQGLVRPSPPILQYSDVIFVLESEIPGYLDYLRFSSKYLSEFLEDFEKYSKHVNPLDTINNRRGFRMTNTVPFRNGKPLADVQFNIKL